MKAALELRDELQVDDRGDHALEQRHRDQAGEQAPLQGIEHLGRTGRCGRARCAALRERLLLHDAQGDDHGRDAGAEVRQQGETRAIDKRAGAEARDRATERHRRTRARQHPPCVATGDRSGNSVPQREARDLGERRERDDEDDRRHARREQRGARGRGEQEHDEEAEVNHARARPPGEHVIAQRGNREAARVCDQQPRQLAAAVRLEERGLGERSERYRDEVAQQHHRGAEHERAAVHDVPSSNRRARAAESAVSAT